MAQLIGTGVKTRYITHSNSPLPGNKKNQRSTSYTAKSTSHIDSVLSGGGKKIEWIKNRRKKNVTLCFYMYLIRSKEDGYHSGAGD